MLNIVWNLEYIKSVALDDFYTLLVISCMVKLPINLN